MAVTAEYKCPNCMAPLIFDSKTQKMKCEYCDNLFTMEQLEEQQRAEQETGKQPEPTWDTESNEEEQGFTEYTCSSCGAKVVGDKNTVATVCAYCGNNVMLAGKMTGMLRPDLIIPFKLDKNDAEKALKEFYRNKPLLPKLFKSNNTIEKVTGIYVPFWLFDCNADGNIMFDAKKIRTWSSGSYDYTETSHYYVTRDGSIGFSKIPADGSQKMDDAYMDSLEPFDYKQLVAFKSTYLSGFVADKYDVNSNDLYPRINQRIYNTICNEFEKSVIGYQSVSVKKKVIQTRDNKANYAMLPVWMLNTKYNDKLFTFAMNGQTGKIVGKLPISWPKFWAYFSGITVGLTTILSILLYSFGG